MSICKLTTQSNTLSEKCIVLICNVFRINPENIKNITRLSSGMTNHLIRFNVDSQTYLLRIPGEGSNELTSRRNEANIYTLLRGLGLTDEVIYISSEDGFKITKYWKSARACDSKCINDVTRCLHHLRKLHNMNLKVSHSFNIKEKIIKYEKLCDGYSFYNDYNEIKDKIIRLLNLLNSLSFEKKLCHIDPVFDNFLFVDDEIYLIDWEYAGMSDPHIDIAMFCLYANYSKESIDESINIYFNGIASEYNFAMVYGYIASAGFLWTIWSDYKMKLGINFDQYAMKQYSYAKEYLIYTMQLMNKLNLTSRQSSFLKILNEVMNN